MTLYIFKVNLRIRNREVKRIQIQIKDPLVKGAKTRSFTIYNISRDEAFNRIAAMFESLENNEEGPVTIKHFNYKQTE